MKTLLFRKVSNYAKEQISESLRKYTRVKNFWLCLKKKKLRSLELRLKVFGVDDMNGYDSLRFQTLWYWYESGLRISLATLFSKLFV